MSADAEDTIAAIITPPGEGGVSIIRISGPGAHPIADQLFSCRGPLPSQRNPYTFVYGTVRDGDEEIDEGILLIWKNPQSYTGEDVIEIQGHGGSICARRTLRLILDHGARSAEPGEFSRRAFLNGRMDLLQAEAVMDLVRAQSDRAQTAAIQQLEGNLSQSFNAIYDELILVAAQLEATMDFPEDELPDTVMPNIRSKLAGARSSIKELLETWNEGHLLRDGARVVLSGKPNAGKSTLMNALLRKERAIVSRIAGTTRDTIEEDFLLEGIPLRIVDTAGLRDTDCEIEQEGIRRTRAHMQEADLNLHLIDLSQPAEADTESNLNSLDPKRCIIVCNKSDLPRQFDLPLPAAVPVVTTSLATGTGIDEIRETMRKLLSESVDLSARPHAVISERHRNLLVQVEQELQETLDLIAEEDCEDVLPAIATLRDALKDLGESTGREYHEELLDSIFGQFCIGK